MTQTAKSYAPTSIGTSMQEHVGAQEKGVHFPPLDPATYPSQLFWLAVFFGLLYLLMRVWILPHIHAIFAARDGRIGDDLARAADLKNEAEVAIADYERRLSAAKRRAHEMAQKTKNELAARHERERRKIEAELDDKIAQAEKQAASVKKRALNDVNIVASDAAMTVVTHLTGVSVTRAHFEKALAAVEKETSHAA